MPTFSERKEATIKADPVQLEQQDAATTALPGRSIWHTLRGFVFWSHERGTVQYDVMVTLILIFVFFSPRLINFNDRPVERNPHGSVLVYPDSSGGWVYQIDAKAVSAKADEGVQAQLLRIIEPISGSVSISRYEPVTDKKGKVIAYKVWAEHQ